MRSGYCPNYEELPSRPLHRSRRQKWAGGVTALMRSVLTPTASVPTVRRQAPTDGGNHAKALPRRRRFRTIEASPAHSYPTTPPTIEGDRPRDARFPRVAGLWASRQEGAIRPECRSLRAPGTMVPAGRRREAAFVHETVLDVDASRRVSPSSRARKARPKPQSAIRAGPSAGRGDGRGRVRRSAVAGRGFGVCGWL